MKKRTLVVLVLISGILVTNIILLYMYSALSAKYTALSRRYRALLANYGALLSECRILEADYEHLKSDYEHLKLEYMLLEDKYVSLWIEYANSRCNYTQLKDGLSYLIDLIERFKKKYNELEAMYNRIVQVVKVRVFGYAETINATDPSAVEYIVRKLGYLICY